jgi:hypothetical protein
VRDPNERITRLMLGLGFDAADGEMRVTKGPNFRLLGGSRPTHERMQETCMRFNEELRRRGKRLEDVGLAEAQDIIRRIESGL